ncbi:hypothetical protein OPT61_g7786 [Boeremia exigua]|uniref:Uncharacterized protein n=1 Tax=Boeremia exigua TaxID=749465 RepID=A0ACC2I0Y8_9PLEO|nr:hypothetical protein OPT61_g7786 [Boeremia exigua]
MKHLLYLAATIPLVSCRTAGQLCSGTAERAPDGNWYCSEVMAITYRNISQPGAYNRTTNIDPNTGTCGHETVRYPATGPLTPLFGQVVALLCAVYFRINRAMPGEARSMRKRSRVPFYSRQRASKQRSADLANTGYTQPPHKRTWGTSTSCDSISTVTSTVTHAPGTNLSSPSCTCQNLPTVTQDLERHPHVASITPAQPSNPRSDIPGIRKRAAAWDRVAYYKSAAPAQATGFSFLANLGDPRQSGTFDYAFGNSLSFVTPAGDKVAPESEPFDGQLDTSEYEIAIFSDKKCDSKCSYWRPNATSHYGWSGDSKAFFIEFQMDHYQNRGSDYGLISDAPAWWFLNAAIPRVLQYGSDRNNIPCSCWSTGCGEFDAFEVLGNGEERAKSTMHRQGNLEGGDSNYFKRPVGRMLKFAVVWHFPHITARVLDDDYDFPESLTEDQIDALVAYDPDSWVHSMFPIGD